MRDSQPNHYFGLDIGTSKVRCVVGMINPNQSFQPSIIGYGEAPNMGMRKGVVVQVEDVVDSVVHALTEAERISGVQIHNATVNINGSHVVGLNSQGVVAISSANREIQVEDCIRVEEAATILQLPPNREIIQVFAKNYTLDGLSNIKDPVGMKGLRLEVDSHIITAGTPNLKNLSSALDKAHVSPNNFTVGSLAAAEATLSRQQKEAGTMVLDIGAGTTNLTVIEDGEIQHVAVIPIGGINITNDLAIGLKTDLDVAEQVKIKHVSLEDDKNQSLRVHVKYEGNEYDFSTRDVKMIVEARLEELFELVNEELQKVDREHKLPGGVVIVGGSSKIPGVEALARDKLQLPARLGKLHKFEGLVDTVADPGYTTAVGLMVLDMLLGETALANSHEPEKQRSGLPFDLNDLTSKLFKRFK